MKLFNPITVKMDDETLEKLDRLVNAEKQHHPRSLTTRASYIRGIIRERADRVLRRTIRDTDV
jgi:predicted transcriptional regulator